MTTLHRPSRRQLLATAAIFSFGSGLAGCGPSQPKQPDAGKLTAFWALRLPAAGPGLGGKEVALTAFRGRPLLVNFWATWCPPCVAEMPMLSRFYAGRGARDWQCLGLTVQDERAQVERFLARAPVAYPVVLAGAKGMEISQTLGNKSLELPGGGLPFTALFDANGHITHRKIGQLHISDLAAWLG
ncbi:MAG: TlpA family protein disulfide reductase [Burkholderiaceae bacterium]|jgi:thiol-disulfide isomerase/thioredoxin|nr:TlpA family protein disulfide reductase [Burkholderiaceae bacterium]